MDSEKKPQKRIDARKAAQNYYKRGMSFKAALVDAGASDNQASKGKALLMERDHLRKAFSAEHKRQLAKLELMGTALSAEEQESVVRGTLLDAVLTEKAAPRVRAAELLGKDRRVNMWQPENAIGIFNMQIPEDWTSRYITTSETPDALAQESLPVLPAKFEPAALESGRVIVPDALAIKEEEPAVVQPPSPAIEFSDKDFEKL
jgi:hypothetical protein